jgi:hypothetical protein
MSGSRRDEWIIAFLNYSAHQQNGRHRARVAGLGISSKRRRSLAQHMNESLV